MIDVNAHRVQRLEPLPESARLQALRWNDDDTLLATFTGRIAVTVAMNPTGQDVAMPPKLTFVRTTTKPHTVIMSSGTFLLKVDTITGKSEAIRAANEHTVAWAVDRTGTPVAREDWDPLKGAYRVYALRGDSIKEILRRDDSSAPTLAGLLPDDSALVLLTSHGKAHQAAWALPLDGSPQKLLAEDPDADITAVYEDAHTGAIVGVYVSGTKADVQWLDPTAQHRQEVLQRSFPNHQVSVYGWTSDGTKAFAYVQSASSPPIYYLVDFTARRADIAAEEYPALSSVKLGELKEITYKARDGTEIPAYLTVPPERTVGPGPLVVLPHGGPNERDYPNFNWIVQFLASRGYTVLQPQFRGSSGFGEAYQKAGYRQWGGLMQDDVTDGVRAMIEQKIADPRRICILGFSYGGYAALAGAAFTPDLYESRVVSARMSVWTERVGSPTDRALDTKSPIHFITSIKAPVLIVYGNSDGVVANEQSLRMAKALRAAGKRVTLEKLADDDDWLSRTDTRVQLLKTVETFLHDNL